jgi:hypothetical protein
MDSTTISVGGSSGYLASIIQALGTMGAAVIVWIAGSLITRRQNENRNEQDREAQYRTHAVELTKLEAARKLKRFELDPTNQPFPRTSILDFLANYRDLKQLDYKEPKDLYAEIEEKRIVRPDESSQPSVPIVPPIQEPPKTE